MREKLIELIRGFNSKIVPYYAKEIADLLIANGVTIGEDKNVPSKWIPVTERLPDNIGMYLVIEKHWIDGSPCRRIAKWNTVDWFTADRRSKELTPRITHWMPMPEAPKGE